MWNYNFQLKSPGIYFICILPIAQWNGIKLNQTNSVVLCLPYGKRSALNASKVITTTSASTSTTKKSVMLVFPLPPPSPSRLASTKSSSNKDQNRIVEYWKQLIFFKHQRIVAKANPVQNRWENESETNFVVMQFWVGPEPIQEENENCVRLIFGKKREYERKRAREKEEDRTRASKKKYTINKKNFSGTAYALENVCIREFVFQIEQTNDKTCMYGTVRRFGRWKQQKARGKTALFSLYGVANIQSSA